MEPMSKEQANDILEPYLIRLRKCIFDAVNGYYTGPDYINVRHKHSPRSSASLCHDHITEAIRSEFENETGFHASKKRGIFTLSVKGIVVLRFKKFNNNLLSSGINTKQLRAFNLQDTVQLEIENLVPNGLLHVGYVMNALGTEVKDVYITYRYGNVNVWSIPLTGVDIAEPELFPVSATISTTRKRTVKAKGITATVGDENAINS
ncbi:hypothetical protein [Paenibacillus sp. NRS-1760]|uniref:hypothetical protein n=1 Tax=Paenibacillus sp. NRS-1760 TaxID=3233902 RepID=UPI003D2ABB50